MSTLETQLAEMNRLARLGSPVGPPVPVPPRPLKYYWGSFALLALGAAGMGLAFALREDPGPAIVFGSLGLLSAGIGGAILLRRASRRSTLQVHQNGLTVERSGRRRVVALDEVESVSLVEREHLNNGVREGLSRRLTVRTPSGAVSIEHLALDGRPDPVGPFLQTLLARVADAAEARIRAGGVLAGRRWVLDVQGLRTRRTDAPVPLAMVAHVAVFQDRVLAWRVEDEAPFFSVSADSANALVLREVLSRHLVPRPVQARDRDGLGRLLFVKGGGRLLTALLAVVGGLMLAGSLWASFRDEGLGLSVLGVAIGAVLFLGSLYMAASGLRCHERGLVKYSPLGRRVLRYAEIETLRYSAVRQYHNGVYTGTAVGIRLVPGAGGKPIRFSSHVIGSARELEYLRDHVAGLVAERLYERLTGESEVSWTASVRLSRSAVHFQRKKLLGKGEPASVALSPDLHYTLSEGVFRLFLPGEGRPALEIGCGEENFYPGLLLFSRLAREAKP